MHQAHGTVVQQVQTLVLPAMNMKAPHNVCIHTEAVSKFLKFALLVPRAA